MQWHLKKSNFDAGDEPAQVRACVENTVHTLKREVVSDEANSDNENVVVDSADAEISRTDNVVVERIGVRAVNAMIDQYEPCYWGCAFALYFHV